MAALPEGTVTFLLTDVEGSTRRWEDDPEKMKQAVADLDALVATVVSSHSGHLLKSRGEGDSHFCVFARASDAIAAGAELAREAPLPVRVALNTGEAELRDGDYFGNAVNRAARLRAVGHGGQVLLTRGSADLVSGRLPPGTSLADRGLHRLKDLGQPEHVYELRWPGARDHLPLRSLDELPTNLTPERTSLIGREREVAEVRERLGSGRLVTLTGAAGCGKTRLALHVAAESLDDHANGAWLADLAPVTDASAVRTAIALALGVTGQRGSALSGGDAEDVGAGLVDHLRPLDVLVVLDNCEHLIDEAAAVCDEVMSRCPGVRILATSREPLGVTGEAAYRVPNLGVPAEGDDAASVATSDAVRLFCDRAALVDSSFELNAATASAVSRICRQLDGIPLAVELAAARVRALGPDRLADRLDQMFLVLKGGSRTAMARQQTLQAAVDWSHDLLSAHEQALLRRLSVFVGGFDLEAAEAVSAGEDVVPSDVLDLLTSLVDKSLVLHDADADRYSLLEAIRQYGRDKLRAADEAEAARELHLDWYAAIAERARDDTLRGGPDPWLRVLDVEMGNVRAALDWASSTNRHARVAAIASDLGFFWAQRGRAVEALGWLDSALAHDLAPDVRGAALATAGLVGSGWGLDQGRVHLAAEALALAGEDRPWWAYLAYMSLSARGIDEGAPLDSAARARDAQQVASALGLTVLEGLARCHEAAALAAAGSHREAATIAEDGVAAVRRSGSTLWLLRALGSRAHVAAVAGDRETDRRATDEAVVACRALGDPETLAQALNLASYAYIDDDPAHARVLAEESLGLLRRTTNQLATSAVLHTVGETLCAVGEHDAAERSFEESAGLAHKAGSDPIEYIAADGLAFVERQRGDAPAAYARIRELVRWWRTRPGIQGPRSLRRLGQMASATGDHERAAVLFGAYDEAASNVGRIPLWAYERVVYEADREATRAALGDNAFDAALARGRAMSFDEAVEFALEDDRD